MSKSGEKGLYLTSDRQETGWITFEGYSKFDQWDSPNMRNWLYWQGSQEEEFDEDELGYQECDELVLPIAYLT